MRALSLELADDVVGCKLFAPTADRHFLEGEVHAFTAPILLRAAWLDALQFDAEPEPSDGKLGEIEEGAWPGAPNAFVGANDIGQAVFGEEPLAVAASSSWVDSGASHGSGLREV